MAHTEGSLEMLLRENRTLLKAAQEAIEEEMSDDANKLHQVLLDARRIIALKVSKDVWTEAGGKEKHWNAAHKKTN